MKRIEYRNRNKSDLKGPWLEEPDKIQWQDDGTGYPCLHTGGILMEITPLPFIPPTPFLCRYCAGNATPVWLMRPSKGHPARVQVTCIKCDARGPVYEKTPEETTKNAEYRAIELWNSQPDLSENSAAILPPQKPVFRDFTLLTLEITRGDQGLFYCCSPVLPGLLATGATLEEVLNEVPKLLAVLDPLMDKFNDAFEAPE